MSMFTHSTYLSEFFSVHHTAVMGGNVGRKRSGSVMHNAGQAVDERDMMGPDLRLIHITIMQQFFFSNM